MNLNKTAFTACAALLVFAFVAAPHACEWGLDAYAWAGSAVTLALLGAPLVLAPHLSWPARVLRGLGYAAGAVGAWVVGLFVANVSIMCRLF